MLCLGIIIYDGNCVSCQAASEVNAVAFIESSCIAGGSRGEFPKPTSRARTPEADVVGPAEEEVQQRAERRVHLITNETGASSSGAPASAWGGPQLELTPGSFLCCPNDSASVLLS